MLSFHQNYKLLEFIGGGFNSHIYKCRHILTKKKFACKIVSGGYVEKSRCDEIIGKMCNHPNINEIQGVYYENKNNILKKYIVNHLGDGDIHHYFEINNFKLSEKKVKFIVKQMLSSINYLHNNNICHKDIKLENFIYNNPTVPFIKLIDFEFSEKIVDGKKMTAKKGTRSFIAPEIINNIPYDLNVDIWSLGISTYMLLSNINPIIKNYVYSNEINYNIDFDIKELQHISNDCKDFLKKTLELNPKKRLTSKDAMNHDWIIYS